MVNAQWMWYFHLSGDQASGKIKACLPLGAWHHFMKRECHNLLTVNQKVLKSAVHSSLTVLNKWSNQKWTAWQLKNQGSAIFGQADLSQGWAMAGQGLFTRGMEDFLILLKWTIWFMCIQVSFIDANASVIPKTCYANTIWCHLICLNTLEWEE